jgi:hypothetical protein
VSDYRIYILYINSSYKDREGLYELDLDIGSLRGDNPGIGQWAFTKYIG